MPFCMELDILTNIPLTSRLLLFRPVADTQTKTAAVQGLPGKVLSRQAFAKRMASEARIKAKPCGWPSASLDTSLRRCRSGMHGPVLPVKFHAKRRRALRLTPIYRAGRVSCRMFSYFLFRPFCCKNLSIFWLCFLPKENIPHSVASMRQIFSTNRWPECNL